MGIVINTCQKSNGHQATPINVNDVVMPNLAKGSSHILVDVQNATMMKVRLQVRCLTNVNSHCYWHFI
jgi:hypothetical protein